MRHRRGIRALLFLSILVSTAGSNAQAQAARIFMDGTFDDWAGLPPVYRDALGDAAAGVDFDGLWLANDERYLFLRIELGSEVLIQDFNEIVLYLDTDDDPSTGETFNGLGAELVWLFGQRSGVFTANGWPYEIGHAPVRIVTAPTVSSTEFEIAFDRSALPAGLNPLFPGNRIAVALQDRGSGDLLPDIAGGVSYAFQDANGLPDPATVPINKARASDVRVLSYNVLRNGLFSPDRKPAFTRLLAAIDPDIIGFQEVNSHSAAETEAMVAAAIPGAIWYSDRIDPDLVVVSRFPITQSYSIPRDNGGDANAAFILDLQDEWGSDLLLIDAHPPCCRNDTARQLDFDAMMAFVRDAKTTGGTLDLITGTPIILLGDMNMVGEARQLSTLVSGSIVNTGSFGPPFDPDWDGTSLTDLTPPHLTLPMTFTWYHDNSAFHPGRLDFLVYTDSVLEPANNFVLFTLDMPEDSLAAHGLMRGDATLASDHLPVVGDFRLRSGSTGVQSAGARAGSYSLGHPYPNPFRGETTVEVAVSTESLVRLTLIDLMGREVETLVSGRLGAGTHAIRIGAGRLPAGAYFIRLEGPEGTAVRPVLIR